MGNARALDQREQWRRLSRNFYLLVIFFRLQFAVAGQQGVVNFGGALYRVNKQRRCDAMEFRVAGLRRIRPCSPKMRV